MSFTEHLGELRNRLIRSVLAVMIGFIAAYAFHDEVFHALARPVLVALRSHGIHSLQALQVTETISVYLQVSLIAGLFLASPYLLWQIWAFIAPGLLARERRFVLPVLAGSSAFFALGVAFCYFVFLPMVVDFLVGFTLGSGDISLVPTVQKTFSLTATFLGIFGLVFEMPLLMFFLALLGVVTHQKLLRFGRYFVVLSVVLAAIFTPPDPLSQMLMAIPLCILYFVGAAFAWVAGLMRRSQGNLLPQVVVVAVFLVFAGSIVLASWLWQRAIPEPSATGSLGPDVAVAVRVNPTSPSGEQMVRHLAREAQTAAAAGDELLVLLNNDGIAVDRLGGKCAPPATAVGPNCRVAGKAGIQGEPPEGFDATEDRTVPLVMVVGHECLARLLPTGHAAPAWAAIRVANAANGRTEVAVDFAPGEPVARLVTWAARTVDRIGPGGPPDRPTDSPFGRLVAWSRGEIETRPTGFSLPAGDRLAGRIVGELAARAFELCLPPKDDPEDALTEPEP